MSYKEFSYFYDYFNYNADYDKLYSQIRTMMSSQEINKGIVCDLGCGTGELAFRFFKDKFEVIAIDNSDEMLDVLFEKKDDLGYDDMLVLKQDITNIDLYGTADVFTCTFDTVNHLDGPKAVQRLFDKVSLFMHPDGVFIFDMNTPYKHTDILKNESFDFLEDEADCHWKNTLKKDNGRTKISINIFDKQTNQQYFEEFYEYYYSLSDIEEMLKKAKLKVVCAIDGESFTELKNDSQRYMFMVKKEQ